MTMDKPDAKSAFEDRLQEAVDWAITDGLTVDDMKAVLRELADTMTRYPEEFQPIT